MGDCATFVTTNFYELLPFAARGSVDITKKPKSSMRIAAFV
jgi:hypothetical protein